ncbi:uncharacterized protein BXIN_3074 [Babesia sp. Xinjiang]|uniref:uncharacterized protein n=1 Tax=Babesia sp. Xinjiang TaxID=462227 RepID=UPI000A224004|nr:uncharacterized protein BXIN_3074 [Babesia sp. Xinjiang]ORM39332.1 hypothetical protein BXIN_3074 [Babesia sp. Xinjiang]
MQARGVTKCSGQHLIYIENEGPHEVKCRKGQNMNVVDAYGICMEDFLANNLKATKSQRKDELLYAFDYYCPQFFDVGDSCVLAVNKTEAEPDRFRVGQYLNCKDGVVFVGLYHCCDKEKTAVADGEEVTLYETKVGMLTPRCPAGKKITILNSGQRGNVICDKGHVTSTFSKTSEVCNGKEMCNIAFTGSQPSNCNGLTATHFVKYTCL